jgi:hypothetical protein
LTALCLRKKAKSRAIFEKMNIYWALAFSLDDIELFKQVVKLGDALIN